MSKRFKKKIRNKICQSRTGLIHELIHDLFTGRKLASNVLVSFCTKFKKNIVFNQTTSNYNYANYVSSIILGERKNLNQNLFI